ncbi:type II toxin-antitoxin system RelE/ParE family toxin [Streptomyces sp. NPDC127108]|uniref:type II toxin-antitoxin system RelE family toxin n=1 Tax=Streptomyces sp. NPDC127108 TaxID=3345361 RepID=UPI003637C4C8
MSEYRVQFTVEARAAYDGLPDERQAQLDKALRVLARDPYHKTATAQLGPDEHLRKAYVAPGVVLEYMVAGAIMVIVVLEIFDESHYLVDED